MNRDLRKYMRDTNVRIVIGAILLLFIVGDGLIFLIYVPNAAIMGVLCIGLGLVPIALIMAFLWLIEWIVKNKNGS